MKRQPKKGKNTRLKSLKVKAVSRAKAGQTKGGLRPDSEDEVYVGHR